MMTVFHWECSARVCSRVPNDRLPPTAAELPAEDAVWIDLSEPTEDEERAVFERFLPVHPLTLGDITKPRREPDQGAHLPKAEEFPDYLFVIVNPLPPGLAVAARKKLAADPGGEPDPAAAPALALRAKDRPQLSAVLTKNVIVTHHYKPLASVAEVAGRLDRRGEVARHGPDYLFHLILDAMVDEYAPVVDRVSARLDGLERKVFGDPSPDVLARLMRLKRIVAGLRKTLILEREVLARLTRGEFDLVDDREIVYYRNVYDHLVRYTELIEGARETVGDLMQTHLAAASNRLNQVMKLLTMISTVVLPMNLIAGIYGMNFEASVVPSYHAPWGFAFALGLMAANGLAAYTLFRWRRWV
ncbi:MAG: magnesium transporter CorA family protein [Gemmataceae bacterium]|nr:magnesium transporter CorA family protein [Gemmataceae bacterium]